MAESQTTYTLEEVQAHVNEAQKTLVHKHRLEMSREEDSYKVLLAQRDALAQDKQTLTHLTAFYSQRWGEEVARRQHAKKNAQSQLENLKLLMHDVEDELEKEKIWEQMFKLHAPTEWKRCAETIQMVQDLKK